MWLKLDQNAYKKNKYRDEIQMWSESILLGVICSIIFFIIPGGVYSMEKPLVTYSLNELPIRLFEALVFGLLLVSPLIQIIRKYVIKKTVYLVCPKCNKIKKENGIIYCECGGFYEDVKKMRWIEKT